MLYDSRSINLWETARQTVLTYKLHSWWLYFLQVHATYLKEAVFVRCLVRPQDQGLDVANVDISTGDSDG